MIWFTLALMTALASASQDICTIAADGFVFIGDGQCPLKPSWLFVDNQNVFSAFVDVDKSSLASGSVECDGFGRI